MAVPEPVANRSIAVDVSLPGRVAATPSRPAARSVLETGPVEGRMTAAGIGGPEPGAAGGQGGPDEEAVRRLLRRLHLVSTYSENVRLSFQVHDGTGRIVLRVLDAETGETLKEIPPEEYLEVMARIAGFVGAVLDRRA